MSEPMWSARNGGQQAGAAVAAAMICGGTEGEVEAAVNCAKRGRQVGTSAVQRAVVEQFRVGRAGQGTASRSAR